MENVQWSEHCMYLLNIKYSVLIVFYFAVVESNLIWKSLEKYNEDT